MLYIKKIHEILRAVHIVHNLHLQLTPFGIFCWPIHLNNPPSSTSSCISYHIKPNRPLPPLSSNQHLPSFPLSPSLFPLPFILSSIPTTPSPKTNPSLDQISIPHSHSIPSSYHHIQFPTLPPPPSPKTQPSNFPVSDSWLSTHMHNRVPRYLCHGYLILFP